MPERLLNIITFIAQGFGSGLAPKAPGTFGSVVGLLLFLPLAGLSLWFYLPLVLLLFLIGIPLCGLAAEQLGVPDHPSIVWDEIVGILITLTAVPRGWIWLLLGFGLFRLFDILKPWPIRVLDRQVHGGLGIMLDDVLAGVFAWLSLQALILAWGQWH